jgi:predicted nucleotide-binding protein
VGELEPLFDQAFKDGVRLEAMALDTPPDQMLSILESWDEKVRTLLGDAFTEPGPAAEYPSNIEATGNLVRGVYEEGQPEDAAVASLRGAIEVAIQDRRQAITTIKKALSAYDESSYKVRTDQQRPASPSSAELGAAVVAPDVLSTPSAVRPSNGAIFVVHGHESEKKFETVLVLERATGREVIILNEVANAGRTILEKFEDWANRVSFAVVLLTGDDRGGTRSSHDLKPRGRQNVIFELGFFFGKLGRTRVAVLHENNVEKPSDIDGLVYITFDQSGAWKYELARELEAAGISVDRSRIP